MVQVNLGSMKEKNVLVSSTIPSPPLKMKYFVMPLKPFTQVDNTLMVHIDCHTRQELESGRRQASGRDSKNSLSGYVG